MLEKASDPVIDHQIPHFQRSCWGVPQMSIQTHLGIALHYQLVDSVFQDIQGPKRIQKSVYIAESIGDGG